MCSSDLFYIHVCTLNYFATSNTVKLTSTCDSGHIHMIHNKLLPKSCQCNSSCFPLYMRTNAGPDVHAWPLRDTGRTPSMIWLFHCFSNYPVEGLGMGRVTQNRLKAQRYLFKAPRCRWTEIKKEISVEWGGKQAFYAPRKSLQMALG